MNVRTYEPVWSDLYAGLFIHCGKGRVKEREIEFLSNNWRSALEREKLPALVNAGDAPPKADEDLRGDHAYLACDVKRPLGCAAVRAVNGCNIADLRSWDSREVHGGQIHGNGSDHRREFAADDYLAAVAHLARNSVGITCGKNADA